jgi:hypothetical protein
MGDALSPSPKAAEAALFPPPFKRPLIELVRERRRALEGAAAPASRPPAASAAPMLGAPPPPPSPRLSRDPDGTWRLEDDGSAARDAGRRPGGGERMALDAEPAWPRPSPGAAGPAPAPPRDAGPPQASGSGRGVAEPAAAFEPAARGGGERARSMRGEARSSRPLPNPDSRRAFEAGFALDRGGRPRAAAAPDPIDARDPRQPRDPLHVSMSPASRRSDPPEPHCAGQPSDAHVPAPASEPACEAAPESRSAPTRGRRRPPPRPWEDLDSVGGAGGAPELAARRRQALEREWEARGF